MTTPGQQPLLREFIRIPERTSMSDFVLKLTEGVGDADATLREYVITPRLVGNFDQALGLIQAAVEGGGSKAAYLHGSFGSGKSHFMAVLHALLRGEKAARQRNEFSGLVDKHDAWLEGRRFLLVPYHLIGAKSLEQAVLGGYVSRVREIHPEAPIPAVHRTDALLDQARKLRSRMGDEAFLAALPAGIEEGEDDEWGDAEPFWTSDKLDSALAATNGAVDEQLRRQLVGDLLKDLLAGFYTNAKEDAEGYISLDPGLAEISRHADELGYDGLVLFLDELVLWLASSIGDQQFVAREAQKVSKFVEAGDVHRPVPIVSFIARQRDLRELVGDDVSGAAEQSFQDVLKFWDGRFDTITLEDRNLPAIARERILKPLSDEAAERIAREFDRTTQIRRDVWDTLLDTDGGTGADLESFRSSYPFSPAFMDSLVHVSSALQRSRTALKLMRAILVQHRDDLRLGQLVPLGDLYEALAQPGDAPFTEKLKAEFEAAQKLYEASLRPHLLGQYGLTEDDVNLAKRAAAGHLAADEDPPDQQLAAKIREFSGDDRLVKTLLLSALAPVSALKNLTVRRLSALNHGSITSPIPGGEVTKVAKKVRDWAGQFGEIKVSGDDDPAVALELVGVDVASVIATATFADKPGARKALVKRLLWEDLGVTETGQYDGDRFDLVWKGSKRSVEVVAGVIRDEHDLVSHAFHPADSAGWRVVVAYPFDEGHGPADARARIQTLAKSGEHPRTVCWVPAFFTPDRNADLRKLVILDYILAGQRFDEHAQHLNPTDRHRARQTLSSQRDALTNRMRDTLREAYGLAQKQQGDVVLGFDDHLFSLDPGLQPKLPFGASLKDAMRRLGDQVLDHQFPGHPDLDQDRTGAVVRAADAKTVLEYIRRAVESDEGRVEVDKKDRPTMRRIANPLSLGEMHEAAFVIGTEWRQFFNQKIAQAGSQSEVRVADLLRWLDEPRPRGLDKLVAHLIVSAFAEQTDRAWTRHGGLVAPSPELTSITDDMALREQRLPSGEAWDRARERAVHMFGIPVPARPLARLVNKFVRELSDQSRRYRDAAHQLLGALEEHADQLGLALAAKDGRLHSARVAAEVLDGLTSRSNNLDIITHLASVDLGGPAERIGRSIKSADKVYAALRDAGQWDSFELISGLPDPYRAPAQRILAALHDAALTDELVRPLQPALEQARREATTLLKKAMAARTPVPPPVTPVHQDGTDTPGKSAVPSGALPPAGRVVATLPPTAGSGVESRVVAANELNAAVSELRAFVQNVTRNAPEARVEITWKVVEGP
ncbi:phage resistance protein [Uniformispora flossi]|uniref:phage resistance protein n=1 Tax=Uniformispora flossi TaxID=3390723 RepID=UPI003C2F994D